MAYYHISGIYQTLISYCLEKAPQKYLNYDLSSSLTKVVAPFLFFIKSRECEYDPSRFTFYGICNVINKRSQRYKYYLSLMFTTQFDILKEIIQKAHQ